MERKALEEMMALGRSLLSTGGKIEGGEPQFTHGVGPREK